jgi:hypothetical protein
MPENAVISMDCGVFYFSGVSCLLALENAVFCFGTPKCAGTFFAVFS